MLLLRKISLLLKLDGWILFPFPNLMLYREALCDISATFEENLITSHSRWLVSVSVSEYNAIPRGVMRFQ